MRTEGSQIRRWWALCLLICSGYCNSLTLHLPAGGVFASTGEMVFSSDASYQGSFEGNKFHGFGRYEWIDGATYEGGWRENKCVSGYSVDLKRFHHGMTKCIVTCV